MSNYNYYFICNELNCEPVRICGSLVSAALRDRLYWTNIPPFSYDMTGRLISNIPQPKDKNICLQDIIESGTVKTRKHTCLNTGSGYQSPNQEALIHRNNTTGMITLIYEENKVRTVNQNELEILHNIPKGYTQMLNQTKAGDLIGDGSLISQVGIKPDSGICQSSRSSSSILLRLPKTNSSKPDSGRALATVPESASPW